MFKIRFAQYTLFSRTAPKYDLLASINLSTVCNCVQVVNALSFVHYCTWCLEQCRPEVNKRGCSKYCSLFCCVYIIDFTCRWEMLRVYENLISILFITSRLGYNIFLIEYYLLYYWQWVNENKHVTWILTTNDRQYYRPEINWDAARLRDSKKLVWAGLSL